MDEDNMHAENAAMSNSWRDQLRQQRLWLVVLLVLGLSGPAAAVAVGWVTGTDPHQITRDPAAALHGAPYVGALSTTGALLWSAAAAVSLLAAATISRSERRRFLLWSGLFGLLLAFDDALMLHEAVLPRLLSVPQPAIQAAYGLLLIVYLARFWRHILRTDYLLLAVALGAFAASVVADMLSDSGSNLHAFAYLVEDGLKFVGIVFWLSYFALTAAVAVRQGHRHDPRSAEDATVRG